MAETGLLGGPDSTLGNIILGLGALEVLAPPQQPSTPKKRRRRAQKDVITWVLDGKAVFVGGDSSQEPWTARMTAPGGFDSFNGITTSKNFPNGADQGSELIGYRANDEVLAAYELDVPPRKKDNLIKLHGRGPKHDLELQSSRLLFQSRDYGLWVPEGNDPYGYRNDQEIQADSNPSALQFIVPKGSDVTNGDRNGFVAWVQGQPITRVAWNENSNQNFASSNWEVRIATGVGPNGSTTARESYSPGANETDVTIDSDTLSGGPLSALVDPNDDLVSIRLVRIGSTGTTTQNLGLHLNQLRLNCIAPGDSYLGSDVMIYLAGQVGFDASLIYSSQINVLPLDWQDGPWTDLATYVASLDDWVWMVLENRFGHGPLLTYKPWGDKTWDVSTEHSVREDLEVLEVFNQVSVPWTTPDGMLRITTVTADPSGDPLLGTGKINGYYADPISDPQPDDTLPTQVAYQLLALLESYQLQGTVEIGGVSDDSGETSPFAIDAGDNLNIVDFPLSIQSQRVVSVTYTPSSVKCDLGQDVSASGIIANLENQAARTPYKSRRSRRGG